MDEPTPTQALTKLTAAERALAEAKTLDEIKQIRDVAVAAHTYAKAAKLGLDAQNHAAEITLRAERKAGELLRELERGAGGDRKSEQYQKFQPETFDSEYRQVLEQNDIAPVTAFRWQQIAGLPEEAFEQHIAEAITAREELTTSGMLRAVKDWQRQEMMAEKQIQPLPQGQYRVFYADPPWRYSDAGVVTADDNYGRAERHYPTMALEEICALPIKDKADDDAVLFLWTTSPMLEEAFKVISAWGFKYKTSFVWDKVRHNFGHYNSVRHEFLLVCTRGSCTPDSDEKVDSVQSIERSEEHSEKPEQFRAIIDRLYTWGRRIELFARKQAPNWEAWGNE